jgi:hypothetical protein
MKTKNLYCEISECKNKAIGLRIYLNKVVMTCENHAKHLDPLFHLIKVPLWWSDWNNFPKQWREKNK